MSVVKLIIKAILYGIVWALTYYFIRKGLDPTVSESDFNNRGWGSFYGGLSVFIALIIKVTAWKYIELLL